MIKKIPKYSTHIDGDEEGGTERAHLGVGRDDLVVDGALVIEEAGDSATFLPARGEEKEGAAKHRDGSYYCC